jgi:hypothetical protein
MDIGLGRPRQWFVIACAAGSICLSLLTIGNQLRTDSRDYGAIRSGAAVLVAGNDPYDQPAVARIVRSQEHLGSNVVAYPYVYPPTVTLMQLPFAKLSYSTALHVWTVLIVLAALALSLAIPLVVGVPTRRLEYLLITLAFGLAFAPLRNGLTLGQIDPLLASLAVGGLLLVTRGRQVAGGVLFSLLLLKPQAALFPFLGMVASGRVRAIVGLIVGVAIQFLAVLAALKLGVRLDPLGWPSAAGAAVQSRSSFVTAFLIVALITATVVILRYRLLANAGRTDPLHSVAIASTLTAVVGPLVYLNLQSASLLMLPFALVAAEVARRVATCHLGVKTTLLAGGVAGALIGDGLFTVSYYSGYSHVLVPLATVGLLLAAVVATSRRWLVLAAVAAATNIALTVPKWPPDSSYIVAAAAAIGLLILLGHLRVSPSKGRQAVAA